MSNTAKFPYQNGPWQITGTREVHRTPWVRVREDAIVWPNKKPDTWTVVEFPSAIGVIALTEDRQVHLVGQHRFAVDRYEWELPEGTIDEDEDPLAAAQRELREETGLTAKRWTPLGSTHPHNSSCTVVYYFFLAQDLAPGPSSPDQTELLTHKLMPFDELFRMVQSSEVMDSVTVVAMYRAWHYLNGR